MTKRATFTLELTLHHNHSFEAPLRLCIDVDRALRISERKVARLKGGQLGLGVYPPTDTPLEAVVEFMKEREMRKDLFLELASQLARQMVERMEDAEGWHDESRIELARKSLGGEWK